MIFLKNNSIKNIQCTTKKIVSFNVIFHLISFNFDKVIFIHNLLCLFPTIATLALGSRPRQGLAKVQAKSEARESHFMLSKG
jgi:hypothetical protein